MTDLQLLEGLKNDSDVCFKYLYKNYFPGVKGYILKNSGDENDARDIFQDAVVTLIENLKKGKYEHKNKLKNWFSGIVKNKWLSKLKKRKNEEPLDGHDKGETGKVFEFPGLNLAKYLKQALDRLGEPCASLLKATVCMKMRMEKAAEIFGYADAHSARQQKLRCLQKLRGLIDPDLLMGLI